MSVFRLLGGMNPYAGFLLKILNISTDNVTDCYLISDGLSAVVVKDAVHDLETIPDRWKPLTRALLDIYPDNMDDGYIYVINSLLTEVYSTMIDVVKDSPILRFELSNVANKILGTEKAGDIR